MKLTDAELAGRIERCGKLARPYRVADGDRFRLKDVDPGDSGDLSDEDKPQARELLQVCTETLAHLQERLYAQDSWALLVAFQAMDAAGKDGAIKHVMSGVNPHGCRVHAFAAPSAEELGHDFLWRCLRRLPERGRIGIFNRSYYEEVLVVRVHRELLERQRLPPELVTESIWQDRYEDIRHIERYLTRNGIVIRKFFLHLSRSEQKKRFLARLDDPDKNWKFSMADASERGHWHAYMTAYEEMIRATATEHAPWYVIPADKKWYTRLVVAAAMIDGLGALDLSFPTLDDAQRAELEEARRALESE